MAAEDNTDGAMIALVPSDADAQRLAVEGYEPPGVLHATLVFLGEAASLGDTTALEAGLRRLAAVTAPVSLKTWATSHFNPDRKPCAVYLVGQGENEHGSALEDLYESSLRLARNEAPNLPPQYTPWIPHLTIGYDLDPNALTEAGQPIIFDRLRLAVGPTDIDIPLTLSAQKMGIMAAGMDRKLSGLETIVAARGERAVGLVKRAVREFNELLHPRGKDGRFIEKHGHVTGPVTPNRGGKKINVDRARVIRFIPNPSNANDPLVEVQTPDGDVGRALASDISTTASPKARLDGKIGRMVTQDEVDINASSGRLDADVIADVQAQDIDPVIVTTVDEALEQLAAGNKIDLQIPDDVSVLLDRMVEIVDEARAAGVDAPNYNLCEVTVQGASLFCAEHKGIPRIRMPQLGGKPLPGTPAAARVVAADGYIDLSADFREMLEARGVKVAEDRVRADYLKASQNELNGGKVAGIAQAIERGDFSADDAQLFISKDNYIVDGHHRWAGSVAQLYDGNEVPEMSVARVDMDILELLAEANRFAKDQGIPQADVSQNEPVARIPDAEAPGLAKPPKVYDKSAADYGLNFQEQYVNDPSLAAARESSEWENLPVESVDPKTLVAVEDELASSSVDKVVNGDVPLREGYVAKVLRKEDGTLIIADGHHRAAMASTMGRDLDVQIMDEAALTQPTLELTGEDDVDLSMPKRPDLQLPSDRQNDDLAPMANRFVAMAEATEPRTTPLLADIAKANGGEMVGLDFRFKKPEGVLDKIRRKAEKDEIDPREVLINDALRYTVALPADQYVDGTQQIIDALREAGFDLPDDKIKNSWGMRDGYNGINATFTDPVSGAVVELQFHTPESFEAKEHGTHADYEIVRDMSNPEKKRRAAYRRMVTIADNIPFPDDSVRLIGTPTSRPFTPNPDPAEEAVDVAAPGAPAAGP
jgi:2'-5' RNA ligase